MPGDLERPFRVVLILDRKTLGSALVHIGVAPVGFLGY